MDHAPGRRAKKELIRLLGLERVMYSSPSIVPNNIGKEDQSCEIALTGRKLVIATTEDIQRTFGYANPENRESKNANEK